MTDAITKIRGDMAAASVMPLKGAIMSNIYGWHFLQEDHKLRGGPTAPKNMEWLTVANPVICRRGLHGSRTPAQALEHAPGPILCLCEFSEPKGEHFNDKFVSESRRIIARLEASEMLYYYARMQALSVVHLWDAPDVAIDYLMTGDPAARAAAGAAARAAVSVSASDAAWAAVWAADSVSASDAASVSASAAASAAASVSASTAASTAAWIAASAAAWAASDAASAEFNALVYECFEGPMKNIGWDGS